MSRQTNFFWWKKPRKSPDAPPLNKDEGGCNDCHRPYGDKYGFPDLILPDAIWNVISPTGNSLGLLCPSCICKRLAEHKYEKVPVSFESGPCYIVEMSDIAPPDRRNDQT